MLQSKKGVWKQRRFWTINKIVISIFVSTKCDIMLSAMKSLCFRKWLMDCSYEITFKMMQNKWGSSIWYSGGRKFLNWHSVYCIFRFSSTNVLSVSIPVDWNLPFKSSEKAHPCTHQSTNHKDKKGTFHGTNALFKNHRVRRTRIPH